MDPDILNQIIYLSYSEPSKDRRAAGTALAHGQLELSASPRLRKLKVIFSQNRKTDSSRHFGSRIVIAPDRTLFLTVGDRGDRNRAQNPFDHAGSVIRLNRDGSVPRNNPYASGNRALGEIWSTGHRNPQGAVWNPSTKSLWTVAHGAKGGDEINVVEKGANYGWPVVTYGENYSGTPITDERSKTGMKDPIFYWLPSIAPSGFAYVTSEKFPELKGNLLVGSLKFQYLELLELDGKKITKRTKLIDGAGRMRDVRQGPDGDIYVAIEGKGIAKLTNK